MYFPHDLVLYQKDLELLGGILAWQRGVSNLLSEMKSWGEGRIRATWGWISVDRGSKATLPLTIPRRVFKSSAKDSTRRSIGIAFQGVPQGSSALRGPPTARASGGPRPPTAGRQANDGRTHRF